MKSLVDDAPGRPGAFGLMATGSNLARSHAIDNGASRLDQDRANAGRRPSRPEDAGLWAEL